MTKLLILITTLLSNLALATPHPQSILKQITRNRPNIDMEYARRLRKAIFFSCLRHKIPCDTYTAILMQESRYKLDAVNLESKDHGISQINEKTARAFGFDLNKLKTNLYYSVEAGAIVLADFMRMYGKKEEDFWTRYNSSKPSKRAIYYNLVVAYK